MRMHHRSHPGEATRISNFLSVTPVRIAAGQMRAIRPRRPPDRHSHNRPPDRFFDRFQTNRPRRLAEAQIPAARDQTAGIHAHSGAALPIVWKLDMNSG